MSGAESSGDEGSGEKSQMGGVDRKPNLPLRRARVERTVAPGVVPDNLRPRSSAGSGSRSSPCSSAVSAEEVPSHRLNPGLRPKLTPRETGEGFGNNRDIWSDGSSRRAWIVRPRHAADVPVADRKTAVLQEEANLDIALKIHAVTSGFLGAASVEERIPFVRHPVVTAERMRGYYASRPLAPVEVFDYPVIGKRTVPPKYEFYFVEALTVDGKNHRFLLVEEAGQPRIDWEASFAYGDMDWEDYLTQQPREAMEFRVYLSPSDYYEIYDEGAYLSMKLTYPGSDRSAYAYCPRDHRDAQALHDLVTAGPERPVVLELQLQQPAGSGQPLQLQMLRLVNETWLIP